MKIGMNQLKNGLGLEIDGRIYVIVDFAHVKPGKGGAFMRTKLKNLKTGALIEKTFRPSDKVELAYIEKKGLQFLYSSHDHYEFMDGETYDQISLDREQLGSLVNYLKENMEVTALTHNGNILTIEPPIFIDLKIASTEPGIRGDTSRAGTKPALTESGMTVLVPLFVNEGDIIRVDTRTNEYAGRA